MQFRIYADDTVIDETSFEEYDNSQPYYDDYEVIEVNDKIIECISEISSVIHPNKNLHNSEAFQTEWAHTSNPDWKCLANTFCTTQESVQKA